VKTIAEPDGEFEDTIIRSENKDVARGIENRRADLTVFQMPLHQFSRFWR
jgi:hypothetical protein